MGAAKRRGTFEERKAQAIEIKRFQEARELLIKNDEKPKNKRGSMLMDIAMAMGGPLNRDKSIFR